MNQVMNVTQFFLKHIERMYLQCKGQRLALVSTLLLIVACQPQIAANPQTELSQPNSAVGSAQSMLIQLEDLNWLPGDQREIEDPTSHLRPNTPYEVVYTTLISPISKPHSSHTAKPPRDPRGASELIWVYQDEDIAKQAFDEMKSTIASLFPDSLAEYQTSGPNPIITNVLTICRRGYDGRFGSYHGCDARMQYGRYLVELAMTVDGQVVTMADWTTMFQLAQDRLVAFVEQES